MSISPVKSPGNIADQVIFGTNLGDVLDGGPGDDGIFGLTGDDLLDGKDGNDDIRGGDGMDTLSGGDGDDTLRGNKGDDLIYGEDDDDVLRGGHGNDILFGGNDHDTLFGGVGNDTLYGGFGNDILDGGSGIDTLYGGFDNDIYIINANEIDTVVEGANQGIDTVHAFLGNFFLSTAGFENIENLELRDVAGYWGGGNLLSNTILGNEQDNVLTGGGSVNATSYFYDSGIWDGNDTLRGFQGQDVLFGGTGDDELRGGNDEDLLIGHEGDDILVGGNGQDFLFGYEGNDRYVYTSVNQSRPGANTQDRIGLVTTTTMHFPQSSVTVVDPIYGYTVHADAFESGQTTDSGDKIDLSAIDSDPNTPGDQAFRFIGDDVFSGDALGEVRVYQVGSGTFWTQSVVEINLGGNLADTAPDMIINVQTANFTPLAAQDFIL